MEKEIKIGEKTFKVREIKYKDFISKASDMEGDKSAINKLIVMLATDLTEEDFENLSMIDGINLMKEVNEINGIGDFQSLSTKKE